VDAMTTPGIFPHWVHAPTADLTGLARAYDSAVLQADPADVKEGSTTTRVQDFANRGPEFDGLYLHAQLLEACCKIIKEPFRLSSVLARTLNPAKCPKGSTSTFQTTMLVGRWWDSFS
jgi:hypothetical protein